MDPKALLAEVTGAISSWVPESRASSREGIVSSFGRCSHGNVAGKYRALMAIFATDVRLDGEFATQWEVWY